ncbi:MAG: Hsp20/alpha crystallin family protein [Clostridiales bacterium]|nr:Hsp20/alpha crystallin family protein [Clostridiales bacterium]
MLMPSIFGENLFDEMMDFPWERERRNAVKKIEKNIMKTDVKETEQAYEVHVELPGYKKEQLSLELENGYLTVKAVKNAEAEEKKEKENYIRRERYSGSCSRSFYIGEDVKHEDIKAKFEDGVLYLTIPKVDPAKVEEKRHISIEG